MEASTPEFEEFALQEARQKTIAEAQANRSMGLSITFLGLLGRRGTQDVSRQVPVLECSSNFWIAGVSVNRLILEEIAQSSDSRSGEVLGSLLKQVGVPTREEGLKASRYVCAWDCEARRVRLLTEDLFQNLSRDEGHIASDTNQPASLRELSRGKHTRHRAVYIWLIGEPSRFGSEVAVLRGVSDEHSDHAYVTRFFNEVFDDRQ